MRKALLLIVALVLITAQVSAYTYYLRKANDTVEIPLYEGYHFHQNNLYYEYEQVDTSKLQSEINFWLRANRGYYPLCKSKLMLYKDFTIYVKSNPVLALKGWESAKPSLGTIRVYRGIERVEVYTSRGKPRKLTFRAMGYASTATSNSRSNQTYKYSNLNNGYYNPYGDSRNIKSNYPVQVYRRMPSTGTYGSWDSYNPYGYVYSRIYTRYT